MLFLLIDTLKDKNINSIFWSPKGRHFVLANVRLTISCSLEFFDAEFVPLKSEINKEKVKTEIRSLCSTEHYDLSECQWDPTGRFFVAYSTIWRKARETGFTVFALNGRTLYKFMKDSFKQFSWRPRPSTILPSEEMEVLINLIVEN